jgi:hypothetical protein
MMQFNEMLYNGQAKISSFKAFCFIGCSAFKINSFLEAILFYFRDNPYFAIKAFVKILQKEGFSGGRMGYP